MDISALIISNWCIQASVVVTVWCTYDTAGRSWVKMKKYQRSLREAESRGDRMHYKRSGSRNRNWRQRYCFWNKLIYQEKKKSKIYFSLLFLFTEKSFVPIKIVGTIDVEYYSAAWEIRIEIEYVILFL